MKKYLLIALLLFFASGGNTQTTSRGGYLIDLEPDYLDSVLLDPENQEFLKSYRIRVKKYFMLSGGVRVGQSIFDKDNLQIIGSRFDVEWEQKGLIYKFFFDRSVLTNENKFITDNHVFSGGIGYLGQSTNYAHWWGGRMFTGFLTADDNQSYEKRYILGSNIFYQHFLPYDYISFIYFEAQFYYANPQYFFEGTFSYHLFIAHHIVWSVNLRYVEIPNYFSSSSIGTMIGILIPDFGLVRK